MKKNYRFSMWLCFTVVCLLTVGASAQQTATVPVAIIEYPDMIVYNGKIATMNDHTLGPDLGQIAEAMAIREGKIQAVGSTSEILSYVGPKTLKMDLHGRTVIPGIIDVHTHIHNNAVDAYSKAHPEIVESMVKQFSVSGKTYAETKRAIEVIMKEKMAHADPGQWAWINLPTGGGAGIGDGVKFVQKENFTQAELDKLAPNTPLLLLSHPAYQVNTAGKKYIDELYGTDPQYDLETDANGYGNLTDYARSLVVDKYFGDKVPLLADIVRQEMENWASVGVTTFGSHITGLRFMDAYMQLVRTDNMPVRFGFTDYFGFEGNADPQAFYSRLGDMAGLGTDTFWTTGVGLAEIDDGPPMICTSMELPPNSDNRTFCRIEFGKPYEKGIEAVIKAHERLAVGHIWGDKALDQIWQIIGNVMKEDPSITKEYIRSRHFSSDHCGLYPRPDQIPLLKDWGWYMSCNGEGISRDAPWLKMLGPDATKKYAKWISPVKSLLAAGVPTVYEHEGDTVTPFLSHAMFLLTRRYQGEIFAPEEAIDRVTLMKMMTTIPSGYMLKADKIGSLEPGKLADFVVLNKDYFTVPLEEIATVYPLMTVLGGKPTYWQADFAKEYGQAAVGPQVKYQNPNSAYSNEKSSVQSPAH